MYGLATSNGMKKQNLKKEVTLEHLATMVAKGFESNAEEVADIKHDLSEMKYKIAELTVRVNKLGLRVDDIYDIVVQFEESDILDLQNRIKTLERTVRAVVKQI